LAGLKAQVIAARIGAASKARAIADATKTDMPRGNVKFARPAISEMRIAVWADLIT
jgi:electron transfer flavoprotein alpha subunit